MAPPIGKADIVGGENAAQFFGGCWVGAIGGSAEDSDVANHTGESIKRHKQYVTAEEEEDRP